MRWESRGQCLESQRLGRLEELCSFYQWKMSFQCSAEDRRGSVDSLCVVICREHGGREGGVAPG